MRDLLTRPNRIDAKSAKVLIEQSEATLVDVRTPEEYAMGHIDGATLLPLETLAIKAEAALADKNANVIVYCQSGGRSAYAAAQLVAMGYSRVHDLGGIFSWPYGIAR